MKRPLYSTFTFSTLCKFCLKYLIRVFNARLLLVKSIFTLLCFYWSKGSVYFVPAENNTDDIPLKTNLQRQTSKWGMLSTPFSFLFPHNLLHPHWSCSVTWPAIVQVVLKNAPSDSTNCNCIWSSTDVDTAGLGGKSHIWQMCGLQWD